MRYSRQKLVLGNQDKLSKSKIGVIGLGAIGSVFIDAAVRAGIGEIIAIDRDLIDETNLQRQTIYSEEDIGLPKAYIAEQKLKKINSEIKITCHSEDLTNKNIELFKDCNLIIDCTDNLETRFLINDYCKKNNIIWIYAGAIKTIGTVFMVSEVCFECIFKLTTGLDSCETAGVIMPSTAIVAQLQLKLALDYLIKGKISKEMIRINLDDLTLEKIKVKQRKDCKACNNEFEYLSKSTAIRKMCGSNLYQMNIEIDYDEIRNKLNPKIQNEHFFKYKSITLFSNGRILVNAENEASAKTILSKYIGI